MLFLFFGTVLGVDFFSVEFGVADFDMFAFVLERKHGMSRCSSAEMSQIYELFFTNYIDDNNFQFKSRLV